VSRLASPRSAESCSAGSLVARKSTRCVRACACSVMRASVPRAWLAGQLRWGAGRRGVRAAPLAVRAAPLAARRPRQRAPLSARCRWSRMGNEGEDPGAWCALSRAARRRARVFRSTLAGDRPNRAGLASLSGANPAQFANCPGSAPLSEAKPGQFAHQRGRCCQRRAPCGKPHAQGTRKPPGSPPSLPKRDHKAARRAEPGAADAKPPTPTPTPTPRAYRAPGARPVRIRSRTSPRGHGARRPRRRPSSGCG
jgi:hypothetical protein